MLRTRTYDRLSNQGGRDPVVVLVADGVHDAGQLVHLLHGGSPSPEQKEAGEVLRRQLARHGSGRETLALLAEHGGPDLLVRYDDARPLEDQLAQAAGDPGSVVPRHPEEPLSRWVARATLAVIEASGRYVAVDPTPAGLDARPVLRYTVHCSHCGKPYTGPGSESRAPAAWSAEALAQLGVYGLSDAAWLVDLNGHDPALDGRVILCEECARFAWCQGCGDRLYPWQGVREEMTCDWWHGGCLDHELKVVHAVGALTVAGGVPAALLALREMRRFDTHDAVTATAALRVWERERPTGRVRFWVGDRKDAVIFATPRGGAFLLDGVPSVWLDGHDAPVPLANIELDTGASCLTD